MGSSSDNADIKWSVEERVKDNRVKEPFAEFCRSSNVDIEAIVETQMAKKLRSGSFVTPSRDLKVSACSPDNLSTAVNGTELLCSGSEKENLVTAARLDDDCENCEDCGGREETCGTETDKACASQQWILPSRSEAALSMAARIHAIDKDHFASTIAWAFAILDEPLRDLLSVQRAYRTFMRMLHPDRAGAQKKVEDAVEILREATDICQRELCQQHPPERPTRLSCKHVCTEPGHRLLKVAWSAPRNSDIAPIHKYTVAVLDPSFGKVIPVAILEPDYNQDLKRFVAFDDPELCSHVLSERDLSKMPNLFKTEMLTVHVAAGNTTGQSEWSILKIHLRGASRKPLR